MCVWLVSKWSTTRTERTGDYERMQVFKNEWRCYADDANDAMMNATLKRITWQEWNKKGIYWSVGFGLLQLSSTYKTSRPEILEWEGDKEEESKR